jgi:hypothetical protein
MTFFPLSSDKDNDPRSDFTSEKSGAFVPFLGRFPEVFTGFPLNVIFAIAFFLKFNQSFSRENRKMYSYAQLKYFWLFSVVLCVFFVASSPLPPSPRREGGNQ